MAALVVPWFIDWNAYRSTFEREAEKILGQPVQVLGSADASLIPTPWLTFTDVKIGGTADEPMMRVARFSVHVDLIPLLTGTFRVVDMTIERPQLDVTINDDGSIDWLKRSEASKALDPDAVSLQRVEITDGSLSYLDSRSGRVVAVSNVNATLDARSLLGPWKVEGGAEVEGRQTAFRVATGRLAENGTLRVKVEANPASVPIAFGAEGDVSLDDKGILWNGGFSLARIAADGDTAKGQPPGWRASGKFDLRPSMLLVPELALVAGREDRPYGLAGSASIDLGTAMRFDAVLKSRQLDLDRAIGKGPNQPANIDQAIASLVGALSGLPTPSIPGRIGFDIPGVIVGGSVIQNLRFDASTVNGGWKIEEFGADLPGRTRLTGDGVLRSAPVPSFAGGVRLASDQPSIFASWWRGGDEANSRPLQPFDMSGQLSVSPRAFDISNVSAKLGGSSLRGSLRWETGTNGGRRDLAIDVKADRFDYDQIAALTGIFAGRNPSDPGGIADAISIKIAAGTLVADDTIFSKVFADGSYANGILNVRKLTIEDVAGASVAADGRIEDLATAPSGQVSVTLKAAALGGVADLALRLLPNTQLSRWLTVASADLGPADLQANVTAQAVDGGTNANLRLNGSLAGTTLDVALGWNGRPADWQSGVVKVSALVKNDDSSQVLRQVGYASPPLGVAGPFILKMEPGGGGALADGVPVAFGGTFAGLDYSFDGRLGVDVNAKLAAHGKLDLSGNDLNPALGLAIGGLPSAEPARPLALTAAVDVAGTGVQATFRDAKIAGSLASGSVELAPVAGRWQLSGTVDLDSADLAFPTRLALGLPADGDDLSGPWSKTSFGTPTIDGFDVALTFNADRLAVADGLTLANAALGVKISGGRAELQLTKSDLAGGTANGSLSIQNPGGDASVAAQFSVQGADLAELAWQRDGRSVADGKMDLSGQVQGSGRSMAGVVSSLSGSGSLKIGAGTARFVNPAAFGSILRAADAGRDLGEAELKKLFAGYLDAGTLPFQRIEGAFTVGAGTIRAQNLEVATGGATIVGGATIDLNAATLNSQWTLTVDPGDDKVAGVVPQVGLVFRGPFEAPERIVDVSPLTGYLQIRASERENERIEKLEAEIREKEKLDRLMRFFREDAGRRAAAAKAEQDRQAAEAAKAEADRVAAEAVAKAKAEADRKAAAAAEAVKKAAAAKAEADRAAAAKAAEAAKGPSQSPGFDVPAGALAPSLPPN
ncbi:hypothetical protein C3941_04975 [Kaistia algarum]|nr:hypothetical protein C3941_04975 [Kaistia algarum]